MSAKHTPGPWKVWHGGGPNDGYFTIGSDMEHRGGIVAEYTVPAPRPDGEVQANARLIAAAPDLLAACQGLLSPTCTIYGRDVDLRAIAEAVAKATGEATRGE